MNWQYKGVTVKELPKEVIGFVYKIHYTDGTKYIGKKLVKSERKKPPLKGMRANARRMVMTEHNWQDYEGSSELTEGLKILSKVITHLCSNKTSLTWLEVKEMVLNNALVDEQYHNKNILKKFWDNCEDGIYDYNPKEGCLFKGDYDG